MSAVGEVPVTGRVGTLTVSTRGTGGADEVRLKVRGGTETYLAWSDDPLPKGASVLVVGTRGPRTIDVVPWTGLTATFDDLR